MQTVMGTLGWNQESSLEHTKLELPFRYPNGDGWHLNGIES